ncbi:MAG: GYD domain-containing protein [Candidatus Deferrimicrobiaceae bacterium]
MATYLGLFRFTDQGIRKVKETTKRAKDFQEFAAKVNVKVREMYWTLGRYDVVVVAEAPDEETITRLTLGLGMSGNVTTETLRAFSAQEMDQILKGLP